MNPEVFGMVKDKISAGTWSDVVRDILECAALATHAETSAIIEWHGDFAEIVAAFGLPVATQRRFRSTAELEELFRRPVATGNLPASVQSLRLIDQPVASYVVSAPLRLRHLDRNLTLTCWRNAPSEPPVPDSTDLLAALAAALRHQFRLIAQVLAPTHFHLSAAVAESPAAYAARAAPQDDGAAVVTDFLLKTLPAKRRLLTRDGISYHVLRSWRAGIKDWQIAALRSAKLAPPAELVRSVAQELAAEVGNLVGTSGIVAVLSVPCGHSTGACFSRQIGVQTARSLNVPFSDALQAEPQRGSSHPKTNARRPPMRINGDVQGPVILVDDVATSGAHICEAARLLRQSGAIVFPIAWIGA